MRGWTRGWRAVMSLPVVVLCLAGCASHEDQVNHRFMFVPSMPPPPEPAVAPVTPAAAPVAPVVVQTPLPPPVLKPPPAPPAPLVPPTKATGTASGKGKTG
ncbi:MULTISPECIES: hypothetical protein [unclassified Azospirillum]|uniref:hypothetical protein n=1 Tax=unclassified Azospirillum TaxID=2630922 RepID=UPI0011774C46|nr:MULTISPECIES: hypothetical protein [unclassified Azospirillum]